MISQEQLASVINDWWYYSVELAPGVVTKGADTPRTPMLPRMMMRNCDLAGMACLDIGSMEGLIPALMARKGASRVVATDAIPHCAKKMDVLKAAYGVQFDFHQIGLIYDLSTKLAPYGGFDFINLSGVLYHVFSPMHVLAGVRPLLKKNGLMVVSTNVIKRGDHTLTFNHQGSLQRELNTFWYHSVPMLDYLLRTFKLVPIDFLFCPHTEVNPNNFVPGLPSGYMSVVCRATDDVDGNEPDAWTAHMRRASWEYIGLCNNAMLDAQPVSQIRYTGAGAPEARGLSLMEHIDEPHRIVATVDDPQNSQTLRLSDLS
jgi:2-polyprenyl-3-methyl-5-hydroxy-6-metoxy-1,4-benzoquinol methylase